jgi:hypothetical protein
MKEIKVRVQKIENGYDVTSIEWFWKIHEPIELSIWDRIRLRLFGIIRYRRS